MENPKDKAKEFIVRWGVSLNDANDKLIQSVEHVKSRV